MTLFVLPSVALLGWVAEAISPRRPGAAARGRPTATDPRVESFLADGEHALAEGNLDGAQADFDKAAVLTSSDARAVLGQARVAAAKADVPWLNPPAARGAAEDLRVTGVELEAGVAAARRTADDALAALRRAPARCARSSTRCVARGFADGEGVRGRGVRAGLGGGDGVRSRGPRPGAAGVALGDHHRSAPHRHTAGPAGAARARASRWSMRWRSRTR